MKQLLFLFFGVFLSAALFSQQATPSYIDVIKKFCSNYEASEDYKDYTTFAKKKEGWYVLQVNRLQSDSTLEERLFYSFAENKYLNLGKFYTIPGDVDMAKQLERFLNKDGSTFDWHGFERIPYYGYNGWVTDIIKDFGQQPDLSDTMLDGLGRAYNALAYSYLWFQNGGLIPGNDTLHRKLGRLEYPSPQRVAKAKEALDNGIIQFDKLFKVNPTYKTIVGNAGLKSFNQYMNGYSHMTMCGNDDLAKQYIEKISLSEPYIQQAKKLPKFL
ncbi:MAG: hypothetical protein ABIO79_09490 [Ferruginibacter sp.]